MTLAMDWSTLPFSESCASFCRRTGLNRNNGTYWNAGQPSMDLSKRINMRSECCTIGITQVSESVRSLEAKGGLGKGCHDVRDCIH